VYDYISKVNFTHIDRATGITEYVKDEIKRLEFQQSYGKT
jgi:hypothetical protein